MTLTLTQSAHKTFLLCQRLFRFRYLDQLAWPDRVPGAEERYARLERGSRFHLLVRRTLEGRPVDVDPELLGPYERWKALKLPVAATMRPELEINVPFDGHLLRARLDLLIVDPTSRTVTIWDWKLGTAPQDILKVKNDPQTLWYLYLTAAAWPQLRRICPGFEQVSDIADRLSMVYWFAQPAKSSAQIMRVPYSSEQFVVDGGRIRDAVATMVDRPYEGYELTADLTVCALCQYRTLCYRTPGPLQLIEQDVIELLDWELDLDLTPETFDGA